MRQGSIDKLKNSYIENRIAILGIFSFAVISIVWLSNSTVNVPIMDYWRDINQLTEKVFRGGFSFNDMWISSAGHRGGFAYLLVAFNIRYLGMNTLIGIYGGLGINIITSILLYLYYKKKILSLEKNEKLKKILFLLVPFALFSFNQWEIYTLAFSFSFALRRLGYFITFFLIEKIIFDYDKTKKYLYEISTYLLVIMLFMSGGYLAALIGSITFCFIVNTILNYKKNKVVPKQYLIITFLMIFALIVYMRGLTGVSGEGQSVMNIVKGILNGSFLKGIFIMLGSSVVDSPLADEFGASRIFISSGIIIFLIYILALTIYFSQRMWKRTYMPLFLMAYTGVNIIVIYYARAGIKGIEYLSASRYSCETILGIIGVVYVLIEYILNTDFKSIKENKKLRIRLGASVMSLIIISIAILSSYTSELLVSSYRKSYQDNLVNMMLNIDDYSNNQLSGFQANNPEQVRDGIYLMKKYKLGVFKNFDVEKYTEIVGNTLAKSKKLEGMSKDGWLAKESKFKISTGKNGFIDIRGYYPFKITNNLTGTIYINDVPNKFKIDKQVFNFQFAAPRNEIVQVNVESNFEKQASKFDTRMVTFILNELNGK